MSARPHLLSLDVRHRRPGFALEAVFEAAGPVVAVMGRSGAGKTTLVELLAGLATGQTTGRIDLWGRRVLDGNHCEPPERRRLGCVFQEPRLFPHMDVRQNLTFAKGSEDAAWQDVVERLELGGLMSRPATSLSGGEARRVALGRALLAAPEVLLLDEPLAGVDQARRGRLLDTLRGCKARGLGMVLVTHSVAEAVALADQVVLLNGGRVVEAGPPTAIFASPRALPVAEGAMEFDNWLRVDVVEVDGDLGIARVDCGGALLKVPGRGLAVGQPAELWFRADEVILSRGAPEGLSVRNVIPARVVQCAELPGRVLVELVAASVPLRAEITREARTELQLAPGVLVHCLIKTRAIRAFSRA